MNEELDTIFVLVKDFCRDVSLRLGCPEVVGHYDETAHKLHQPALVAVVGTLDAGKSTFVNTFLGRKYCETGVKPTTATVNVFRHDPETAAPFLRCHFQDGTVTDESLSFVAERLSGTSSEVAELARTIAYLEWCLPEPRLQKMAIVDTPGLGSSYAEHDEVTWKFLRDQPPQAILYLLDKVPRVENLRFFAKLDRICQTPTALTTLGIITRIDRSPKTLADPTPFCEEMLSRLNGKVNRVFAVSSELERLARFFRTSEVSFIEFRRSLVQLIDGAAHHSKQLEDYLHTHELFDETVDDTLDARRQIRHLLRGIDWNAQVFALRQSVHVSDYGDLCASIENASGFQRVGRFLDVCFFQRAHLLRAGRLLGDLSQGLELLKTIGGVAEEDALAQSILARRFGVSDEVVRRIAAQANESARLYRKWSPKFAAQQTALKYLEQEYSLLADLEMSDPEDDGDSYFNLTSPEVDELKALFGRSGLDGQARTSGREADLPYLLERASYWRAETLSSREQNRCWLAECASRRYHVLLNAIESGGNAK